MKMNFDLKSFFTQVRNTVSLPDEISKTHEISNNKTNCPFHQETSPSLTIYPDKNNFYCFGCGTYGDVIDWVAHTQNLSLLEAAKILGQQANIPYAGNGESQNWENLLQGNIALTEYANLCHQKLIKDKDTAYEYALSIGLTDELIGKYHIGVGIYKVPKNIVDADCGILSGFKGRLLYPCYDGKFVENIVARYPGVPPENQKKTLNLYGKKVVPFNKVKLNAKQVLIVEGPKDCILAETLGYDSCALIGTTNTKWSVGDKTTAYICLDGENGNGSANISELSMKHGQRLHQQGKRVYIMKLPVGKDPADIIWDDKDKSKAENSFHQYYKDAKPYLTYLIDGFNWKTFDIYQRQDAIDICMEDIVVTPKPDFFVKKLSKLSGEPVASLKSQLKGTKPSKDKKSSTSKSTGGNEQGSPIVSDLIRWTEKNPKFFRPAQFWDDGVLAYTIYLPMESGMMPFIITSNKEAIPLTKEYAKDKEYLFNENFIPDLQGVPRWSIGTESKYGVHAFLTNGVNVETKPLLQDVVNMLRKYIKFPKQEYPLTIALWIMNTYIYYLWDSVAYLHLHAMKESGKTNTLALMDALCFNSWMASLVTEASITREVNNNQATTIIDEAEQYTGHNERNAAILAVLNSGYKKVAKVSKAERKGDGWAAESFWTYSPKAFASIRPIENVLSDRCITFHLESFKDLDGLASLSMQKIQDELTKLRDRIYCWAMQHANPVYELSKYMNYSDVVIGRQAELWEPIFLLAAYADGNTPDNILQPWNSKTLDTMLSFAGDRKDYRKHQEDERNPEKSILLAIVDCMKYYKRWQQTGASNNYYGTKELIEYAQAEYEIEITMGYLHSIIFDLLKIADRKEDKNRIYLGGKAVSSIRLNRDKVSAKFLQMWGEQIDWQADNY